MCTGNLRLPPPRGFAEDQTVTVISITPQEPPNSANRPPPQRRPLAAWAEQPEVDNSGGGGRAAGGQLFGPGLNGGEKNKEVLESERTDSGWRRSGSNPRIATNGSLTGWIVQYITTVPFAPACTATKIPFMYSFSYISLYIPRIGPHISRSRIGRSIVGIYKSLTDT
jgi:hypothetical protein